MTSTPLPSPPGTWRPPLRLGLTLLQLAVMGTLGVAAITLLAVWLPASLALVVLLGLGLLMLVGLVYAIFALSWFETRRVTDLYELPVAELRWQPSQGPGFGQYLRSLGRNLSSGRMWAAFGSFALSVLLGAATLNVAQWTIESLVLSFAPLTGAEEVSGPFGWQLPASQAPLMLIITLVGCAALVGLAFLHRAITTAIIGSVARETDLSARAYTSSAQRAGALRAAELERTRIERDLHDGVQPRLVSVGMALGLAHQQIDTNPQAAKELVAEAHTSTKAAITELRQLTRGIYASVLEDRGLDAALSAVAGRSHIPVKLDVDLPGRCEKTAEAAVYFSIAEALNNAAKHSRASECRVTVRLRAEQGQSRLWARVEDNGVGGAAVLPGGGLDGISNRVLAAGGTVHLDSLHGGPTALEVNVPCAY